MRRKQNHNISWCLDLGRTILSKSPTPLLDSQILMAHSLKVTKEYLYKYPDKEVKENSYNRFLYLSGKRSTDYPIAYILGKKEFYGLDFYVNESTLIPRPETEAIVDLTINHIKKLNNTKINLIDLGTGSGCIPISILCEINKQKIQNQIEITAVDNSKEALKIASKNFKRICQKALRSTLNIRFLDYEKQSINCNFDIIISNPPYLTSTEIKESESSTIHFEPKKALSGKTDDGLHFYKIIEKKWLNKLNPNGIAILEIGTQSISSFEELFNGYTLKVIKDFANKNRFLIISHQ